MFGNVEMVSHLCFVNQQRGLQSTKKTIHNNNRITMIYDEIVIAQLTDDEISQLKASILGYGKLAAASKSMGISNQSIYNAIDGDNLSLNTLNAIRKFLKTAQ